MDTRKRLPAKERGSYRAYLKNPNVSPSKLPRTSLYRHKKNKEAAKKDKQIEQYPQEVHLNEEGPSTSNQLSEESNADILCEDLLETEVLETEGVETEVPFLDQCTFDYPGDSFLDDYVEENEETGDKDDDDDDDDVILLEEI